MTLTASEVRDGVWAAWLAFNALFVVAIAVVLLQEPQPTSWFAQVVHGVFILTVLVHVVLVGGCGSALTALACIPLAQAIGRLLRGRPAAAHVAAFTAIGVASGLSASAAAAHVLSWLTGNAILVHNLRTFAVIAVGCAATAALGGACRCVRRAQSAR